MSKTLIVILILILAAGFLLLRTFGSPSSSVSPISGTDQTASNSALPYGATLSFQVIQNFYKNAQTFTYPQVSADQIGVAVSNLIQSQKSSKP